jgi:phosphoserine phosphatase
MSSTVSVSVVPVVSILYLCTMNIYLFDFDNTIVELPYKETIEYLDQKESLDPKLNFKLIQKTREDYLRTIKL